LTGDRVRMSGRSCEGKRPVITRNKTLDILTSYRGLLDCCMCTSDGLCPTVLFAFCTADVVAMTTCSSHILQQVGALF
jgi:hypothetical protein